jgi:hypothetical protein
MIMVTWENYEEMMLLHVDGELNVTEEKALMQFVVKHPDLQEELEAYESARLVPEMTIVYPAKEQLMKPVPAGKVISLTPWLQYGVAAAAMLIILFTAGKWFFSSDKINGIKDVMPVAMNPTKRGNAIVQQKDYSAVSSVRVIKKPTRIKQSAPYALNKPASVHSNEKGLRSIANTTMESIQSLNPSLAVTKPSPAPTTVAPVHTDLLQASIPFADDEVQEPAHKQEFLAWLPMTDEKKEGIEGLKTNLKEKISKAKHLRDNLKETDLVLKLGTRDIHVLNF